VGLKRLVVLASGRGTTFKAILDAIEKNELPNAQILALFTDKPDAPALAIAKHAGVPTHVMAPKKESRESYDLRLKNEIHKYQPDFIVLTGFMRLLSEGFVDSFSGKILNIHPSLLPNFPGMHAQRQALKAGAKVTGCTVHYVTAKMDDGPIIAQSSLNILPDDTEATLSTRLLPIEHATYLKALKILCSKD